MSDNNYAIITSDNDKQKSQGPSNTQFLPSSFVSDQV